MAVDSNTNSLAWDSSSSLLQSQSLSNIPNHYDRSIIAPLTLSQRKHFSHATLLQLPPLKFRSTLTWGSSEEEILLSQSATSTTERESTMFRQRLDRLRTTLSVRFFLSLEDCFFPIENNLGYRVRYVYIDNAWLFLEN
jgi:hypothetical protein